MLKGTLFISLTHLAYSATYLFFPKRQRAYSMNCKILIIIWLQLINYWSDFNNFWHKLNYIFTKY